MVLGGGFGSELGARINRSILLEENRLVRDILGLFGPLLSFGESVHAPSVPVLTVNAPFPTSP